MTYEGTESLSVLRREVCRKLILTTATTNQPIQTRVKQVPVILERSKYKLTTQSLVPEPTKEFNCSSLPIPDRTDLCNTLHPEFCSNVPIRYHKSWGDNVYRTLNLSYPLFAVPSLTEIFDGRKHLRWMHWTGETLNLKIDINSNTEWVRSQMEIDDDFFNEMFVRTIKTTLYR